MSTMPHARFRVNPMPSSPRPARTFAEGLLETLVEELPPIPKGVYFRGVYHPDPVEQAWDLGYTRRVNGGPCFAPDDMPPVLADAFYDGWGTADGEIEWAENEAARREAGELIEAGYGYR